MKQLSLVFSLFLLISGGRYPVRADDQPIAEVFGYTFIRDEHPGFFVHPEPLREDFSPEFEIYPGTFLGYDFINRSPDDLLILHSDRLEGELTVFIRFGTLFSRYPLRFEPSLDATPKTYWATRVAPTTQDALSNLVVFFEDGTLIHYRLQPPGAAVEYQGFQVGPVEAIGQSLGTFPGFEAYAPKRRSDARDLFLVSFDTRELIRVDRHGVLSQSANPCEPEASLRFIDLDLDGYSELLCGLKTENNSAMRVSNVFRYKERWEPLPAITETLRDYHFTELAILEQPVPTLVGRTAEHLLAFRLTAASPAQALAITEIEPEEELSILGRSPMWGKRVDLLLHNKSTGYVRQVVASENGFSPEEPFSIPAGFADATYLPGEFRFPGIEQLLFVRPKDGRFAFSSLQSPLPMPAVRVTAGDQHVFFTSWRGFYHSQIPTTELPNIGASLVGHDFQEMPVPFDWIADALTLNFQTSVDSSMRPSGPQICNGFNWNSLSWGARPAGSVLRACGPQQLVVGADDETINYSFDCCSVPSEDIFADEWEIVTEECSEDYVVVGPIRETSLAVDVAYTPKLSCRKINTVRYQLGEARAGAYWGIGYTASREQQQLIHSRLPAAVRYGIGRADLRSFGSDGCVGQPLGAALVAKFGKNCREMRFREIQYRGLPGDPPRGTALTMFPQCHDISSAFEANPRCLR